MAKLYVAVRELFLDAVDRVILQKKSSGCDTSTEITLEWFPLDALRTILTLKWNE